jgi:hypothetical protein
MFARVFLVLIALIWIPSGIMSFIHPGTVADVFHITSTTQAGLTELRALYGGMGVALGVQALVGVIRPSTVLYALVTQSVLNVGLVISRFFGATLFDGFPRETLMMLTFEGITAALAVYLAQSTYTRIGNR